MKLNSYDLMFVLVCLGVAAYQLWGILRAKKGMRYPGQQPGKTGATVLGVGAIVLCAIKKGDLLNTWPVFVALGLLLAVYAVAKIGVGEAGVYRYSRIYSFDKLKYYEVDVQRATRPILRVGTDLKEVGICYADQKELEAAVQFLSAHGLKDASQYRREMGQQAEELTQRRQEKKEARKKK